MLKDELRFAVHVWKEVVYCLISVIAGKYVHIQMRDMLVKGLLFASLSRCLYRWMCALQFDYLYSNRKQVKYLSQIGAWFPTDCLLNGWISLDRWCLKVDLVFISIFSLRKTKEEDTNLLSSSRTSHSLKTTSRSFYPSTTALSCFTFLRLHSSVHDKQENNDSVEEPHWNLPGQHNRLQSN